MFRVRTERLIGIVYSVRSKHTRILGVTVARDFFQEDAVYTPTEPADNLQALKWVEDAVSVVDMGLQPLTSFYLSGGYMHAHNGRMVAAYPFDISDIADVDVPYHPRLLVPAEAFSKVLKNLPDGDVVWSLSKERLTLKIGGFKASLKLLDPETWPYLTTPPRTNPIPEELIPALRKILPFCSENATQPWATCIGVMDDHLYASNNVVVARARCSSIGSLNLLIPRWATQFIVDREEGLCGWEYNTTSIAFSWENGGWMRSTLVNANFPDVSKIFASIGTPNVEITDAWRRSLTRISRIAEDPVVRLRLDSIRGRSDTTEILQVEDGASNDVPEGVQETLWDLRYLAPVAECATHWNPLAYPQPAGWRGDGIEGAILGRRS